MDAAWKTELRHYLNLRLDELRRGIDDSEDRARKAAASKARQEQELLVMRERLEWLDGVPT